MFVLVVTHVDFRDGLLIGCDVWPTQNRDQAIDLRDRLIAQRTEVFGEAVPSVIDGREVRVHISQTTYITYVIKEAWL